MDGERRQQQVRRRGGRGGGIHERIRFRIPARLNLHLRDARHDPLNREDEQERAGRDRVGDRLLEIGINIREVPHRITEQMDETSRQQDAAGEGITSGQDGGRGPSPHQQWKDRPSAPHEEDDDDREDLDGGHERISESAAKRAERNCETNSRRQ